jgi:hypothetical protein
MKPLLKLVLLLLCAGSLSAQKPKRDCTGDPPDSAWSARSPVYRNCEVDKQAEMRGTPPRANFEAPPGGMSGKCYKAEFQFVVDSVGAVEQNTVRTRSTNDKELEDAVRATLPMFKFSPAELAGRPVRQVVLYKSTVSVVTRVAPAGSTPPNSPPRGSARC